MKADSIVRSVDKNKGSNDSKEMNKSVKSVHFQNTNEKHVKHSPLKESGMKTD